MLNNFLLTHLAIMMVELLNEGDPEHISRMNFFLCAKFGSLDTKELVF